MSVERIIVETNDETGNNPVEYDWEFDPDGTFHMSGDGEIPAANKEITRLKPLVAGEKNIGKLVDICDDLFYFGREYLDSAKKMEAISQGLEAFAVCRCAKTAGTSTERRRHWQTCITRMARAICMCSLVWKPIGAGTGAGTIGATHCNRHGSVPARHASVSPER